VGDLASPRKKKAAASAAYLDSVKGALEAGHAAAWTAYAEFAKTAERTPEGRIADVLGAAWVSVYKPSYRLRAALKALGEVETDGRGTWIVSNFDKHANEQSVTAHRIACEAACAILKERFPDDGEFLTHSYRT
jgi:hypothetical protein